MVSFDSFGNRANSKIQFFQQRITEGDRFEFDKPAYSLL